MEAMKTVWIGVSENGKPFCGELILTGFFSFVL